MDFLIGKGQPAAAPGAAAAAKNGALIFDVGAQDFEAKVLKASMTIPVVVDFWAPWCGPCKQLTPALESAVKAANGAVLLAKVNIDQHPQLAQLFRVQSVPTVYALFQGQPVDGFMGAVPDSQVRQFIEKLAKMGGGAPVDLDALMAQAEQALVDGKPDQALELFQTVLEVDEAHLKAQAGIMRALVALGELDAAVEMLDGLPPQTRQRAEFDPVRSALSLAQDLSVEGSPAELEARLTRNPDDHQARYDLAMAQFGAGQRELAVDLLLDIVRRDRTWNEDGARQQLLKLFDVMGGADPLTVRARRKLSSILFA